MCKIELFFRILILIILLGGYKAQSQYVNIPLGYNFNDFLGPKIHQNINHTSFKPLITKSVNVKGNAISKSAPSLSNHSCSWTSISIYK